MRTLPQPERSRSRVNQRSLDHPMDVSATPTLPDPNLRYQEALHDEGWLASGKRRRSHSILHCCSLDKNSLSREALGFIAVCFSCDELINSIGLSGLHPTIRVPARPEPEGP